MKTRLLLLLLFVSSLIFAQAPIDDIMRYTFRNGSIQNQVNPGTNDLNQTNSGYTIISGWDNEANSALDNLDARFVAGSFPAGSNTQSANMSYSFWVNWTANETYRELFRRLNNNQQGASGGIYIFQQNGIISASISDIICTNNPSNACDSANRSATVSTPTINDGNWHHIVVTFEESIAGGFEQFEVKLYLDGVLSGSNTTDLLETSWQTYMYSGNRTLEFCGNQVFGFSGKVDDVRVFDRTLTSSEAVALYNYGEPPVANQIYVNKDATGTGDGLSWVNAFTNLKTAMQANPLTPNFWVAEGTYTPGSLRTDSFILTENQKIYGGFNGTEVLLSERNILANPTILSGDINDNDDAIFSPADPNRADNSYRLLNISGDNTIIDGFVISGANANGSITDQLEGSGVNITGSYTVTVANCQFTKHTLGRAGIIKSIDNSGNVTINVNNTIFKDNQSVFATCFYGRSFSGTIDLSFEGNLFTNNTATTNNGASLIWLRQDTNGSQNLDIVNSTFSNNTLNSGTPVITYLSNVPSVNIYNSIFWNNTNGSGTIVDALQSGASGVISNNLSNNGFTGYGSASNILTGDPLFVDAANEDFRLGSGSPAIDSGANNFVNTTEDLDGNQRIFNSTVDMGAYEYNPSLSNDSFQTNNEFVIYPNPIENILNIKAASNITNVEIYTIQGVKVLESNLENIDVSTLSSGLYIINIQDENNRTTSKKFIKK